MKMKQKRKKNLFLAFTKIKKKRNYQTSKLILSKNHGQKLPMKKYLNTSVKVKIKKQKHLIFQDMKLMTSIYA